jgi:lipoate-protein ligase A
MKPDTARDLRFLDLTLPTLAENLALDEALLLGLESGGGEVLRVWEWPTYAVVLGAGGWLGQDVDEIRCRAEGVEIARRSSGGGTVLLGPGCLLYTLVLSYERAAELREIGSSYRYILMHMVEALRGLLPELEPAGISDLASRGRKFSGNAQQRKARGVLHHGTLLYDFDISRVPRYLRQPARQPEYRAGREHTAFLINLPATAAELTNRLRATWNVGTGLADWPRDVVAKLSQKKYTRVEWLRRRV